MKKRICKPATIHIKLKNGDRFEADSNNVIFGQFWLTVYDPETKYTTVFPNIQIDCCGWGDCE